MSLKDKQKFREYQRAWRLRNKERLKAYNARWHAANKTRRRPLSRAAYVKRTYGLTIEQHAALFDAQGRVCAVCGDGAPGGSKKQWHVDHNHDTGVVRGLLCFSCNVGLGSFKDSTVRLSQAAAYLRKHKN